MKVVTYIYEDFTNEISSTHEFRRSAAHFGYEVVNVAPERHHVGNARVIELLCEQFGKMTGPAMYADGADTFFVDTLCVHPKKIFYSTEKAIWPPTDEMKMAWEKFYPYGIPTPWAYLNGGAYCGPAELIAEFLQNYVLPNLPGLIDDGHAQSAQAFGFIEAKKHGFPVFLDKECHMFQSIAFAEALDFSLNGGQIQNNITKRFPSLIHGNGRTPMGHIYELLK